MKIRNKKNLSYICRRRLREVKKVIKELHYVWWTSKRYGKIPFMLKVTLTFDRDYRKAHQWFAEWTAQEERWRNRKEGVVWMGD